MYRWHFGSQDDPYQIGDHLRVSRRGSLIAHEGIYVGDGWVIHVEVGGVAEYVPIDLFARGGIPQVVNRARTWEEAEVRVERASARLGQPYGLISFNCQHLVSEAISGRAFSPALVGVMVLAVGMVMARTLTRP